MTKALPYKIFSARIKSLRGAQSQAQFAQALGISRASVAQYEQGKRLPDGLTLFKIATMYGISIDYLLGLSEDKQYGSVYASITEQTGLSQDTVETLEQTMTLRTAKEVCSSPDGTRFFDLIDAVNLLTANYKKETSELMQSPSYSFIRVLEKKDWSVLSPEENYSLRSLLRCFLSGERPSASSHVRRHSVFHAIINYMNTALFRQEEIYYLFNTGDVVPRSVYLREYHNNPEKIPMVVQNGLPISTTNNMKICENFILEDLKQALSDFKRTLAPNSSAPPQQELL